jgi:hypothetical protein
LGIRTDSRWIIICRTRNQPWPNSLKISTTAKMMPMRVMLFLHINLLSALRFVPV